MNWVIISPGNGLPPVRRQALTWTNAVLLSTGLLGTYFSEIWIGIRAFSFKKMLLNMSSAYMAAILSRGDELNMLQSATRRNLKYIPATLTLRNDTQLKYVDMFPHINSAWLRGEIFRKFFIHITRLSPPLTNKVIIGKLLFPAPVIASHQVYQSTQPCLPIVADFQEQWEIQWALNKLDLPKKRNTMKCWVSYKNVRNFQLIALKYVIRVIAFNMALFMSHRMIPKWTILPSYK